MTTPLTSSASRAILKYHAHQHVGHLALVWMFNYYSPSVIDWRNSSGMRCGLDRNTTEQGECSDEEGFVVGACVTHTPSLSSILLLAMLDVKKRGSTGLAG